MPKTLIATVAAAVVALSASTFAGDRDFEDVFVVKESSETPTVVLSGNVVPFKEVTLAAQLPGRVKFIAGIEGELFDSGTTLVALDEDELLAKRSAAYAQAAAADADLRNAGVQYSRELWSPQSKNAPGGMAIPNLFDQMFTRPAEDFFGQRDRGAERSADLYASGTRMEQARSAMLRAQSEIRAIDAKLRDAKSLAPFDGVIVEKYVEEGDTVQPGQPMLKFADVTWLQIEVDVPASLAQGLQPMSVLQNAATFDNHPEPVAVRVAQIFPMADVQRHTVKVKFDIPQGVSKPGMYAKVLIPDTSGPAKSQLPVIPSTAIRYRGSLPVVYIQNEKGEPELRMVRQGKRLDNGMTMVLSGIAPGDRVYPNPGPGIMTRSRSE
ncbi:MAG: efflux RND transporter periplasmic adaptor subunit [Gammaproteobacteria bacterium]|nr:efflux RND transporter periplasmic adaptor subunit [Gammaproteobacteria bacterium]MCP5318373.1 efflux RND transporter periplasmic adaptor subunit [Chromatiaceae bacterium]MCW5584581.1 efflux RND transporter periplasmic adaptor subunit [Chromatiales bacterium]MCB1816735.1 efflux RND transporter periplasmic adaptor subunit [Gammaproteobacteria bacterium]HOP15487.1 efflux RND transporter periplasmic adaptor subunit [Gammaproteobacteria bacterium]